MTDPFEGAEIISSYSTDQGVEDGLFIRLGPTLVVTTNFAHTVATKDDELDVATLRQVVSGMVSEYVSGTYACPKRADKHNEADRHMAYYIVKPGRGLMDEGAAPDPDEERVWVTWDGQNLTIMLPEDY